MKYPERNPRKVLEDMKEELWLELHKILELKRHFEVPQFVDFPPNPSFPYLKYDISDKRIGITQDFDTKAMRKCYELELPLLNIFGIKFNEVELINALCIFFLSHEYVHAIHHQLIGSTFDKWEEERKILSTSSDENEKLRFLKSIAWQEGIATAISTLLFAEALNVDKIGFWNRLLKYSYFNPNNIDTEQGRCGILCGIGTDYFLDNERITHIVDFLKLNTQEFPEAIDRKILEWPK